MKGTPAPEFMPVSKIPGIGEQKAALLEQLGIRTVLDLLLLAPSRFEDFRIRPWTEVKDGEKITVAASIQGTPAAVRYGGNKVRISCAFFSDPIRFQAVWFNQAFMQNHLKSASEWVLTGKWDAKRRQLTVSAAEKSESRQTAGQGSQQSQDVAGMLQRDEQPHEPQMSSQAAESKGTRSRANTIQPVYPLVAGLTQMWIRKTIQSALAKYAPAVSEWLPDAWVNARKLIRPEEALSGLHMPEDPTHGQLARRRLAYEESILFQARLHASKQANRREGEGIALVVNREKVRAMVLALPFALTTGQKYVIKDILDDLEAPSVMQRLLQGDVGSGKTVVSAVAAYAVHTAGAQTAVMVPTELLAEQQARAMEKFLSPHGLTVALLTGRTGEKARREILGGLQMGLIDVIVGTHALIQPDVYFRQLGLVVVDEQHRFGVQQRALLREKGLAPDVLTMTATPIPRTLAITLWGDLDVSTLREKPAGRQPIDTNWFRTDQLMIAIQRVRESLHEGRQAYVICPLIEESEMLDVQNAVDTAAQFQQAMKPFVVGLLHGRLPGAEKESVMQQFVAGGIQVLVSTTVVEVGVDVPNATEMIILDADRFGLSQLHQLRGRVGRGSHRSRCWLIADPKGETGQQRMEAMVETDDGFEIAQKDLQLRGPGDYFGTKQSGMPTFRFVDVLQDAQLMEQARDDVASAWSGGRLWTDQMYRELLKRLQAEGVFDQRIQD